MSDDETVTSATVDEHGSTGAPGESGSSGGRNLPVAIVTGVVLAATFIGSVLWHPLAFTVVVALLVTFAVIETSATLRQIDVPVAVPAVLAGGLVTVFGAYRSFHAGQAVGVFVLFAGTIAWLLADPERHRVVETIGNSLLLGLWTGFLASFSVLLVQSTDGAGATLLVIGAAIFGDIGAYAVGSMVGRTKVAPAISPNKTVEGLLGGVVVAAAIGALAIPPLFDGFDAATAAMVAAACALAGFLGDLVESMVKRDLGVKDLGAMIPGHGGVMDRVDGLLVAIPIGFYIVMLLR